MMLTKRKWLSPKIRLLSGCPITNDWLFVGLVICRIRLLPCSGAKLQGLNAIARYFGNAGKQEFSEYTVYTGVLLV